ncbi:MAG: hypothetical protein JWM46_404 [Candidatus Kaiserbacteria bacterium]|nr:hypothetical protein [Candidatus Kaiserbacteria bacterium]
MKITPGKTVAIITGAVYFAAAALASADDNTLGNPLNPSFSSIPNFIAGALRVMVQLALPILTLMIVYSGFLFVFARGNQEKLSTAKTNFMYVIIGSVLILGAWVIATLISGTVSQLTTG